MQIMVNVFKNFHPKLILLAAGYFLLLFTACHSRKGLSRADSGHTEPGMEVMSDEADLRTKYSALLGIEPQALKNMQIYAFIDQWMGTPYLNGGSTHAGIDCSAFSQNLVREAEQKAIPRTSFGQSELIHEKNTADLEEGDLVFFSSVQGRVDHVGVYLGNGKFVHASLSKGVTVNDIHQSWYQKNYIKGGSPF